tara:strand:- start:352 stop:744 length:393 start_codon:yes stop_codon:yes gene_type:complete
MATLTATHPAPAYTAVTYNGIKPLTFFEIAFATDVSAQNTPGLAIQKVLAICSNYATVVIVGDLFNTSANMTIAVEKGNDSLDWDGGGAETLVEQIEDEIIALGDQSGASPAEIDYTGVTCTVKTVLHIT